MTFSAAAVSAIERVQAQVAKVILGLPVQASNTGAVAELGLKTLRHMILDRQLCSYFRLLNLPQDRLAHVAIMDHLEGGWRSPYMKYIYDVRVEVDLLSLPLTENMISKQLNHYFMRQTNDWIQGSQLPALKRVTSFSPQQYVSESMESTWISKFRLGVAGLGNKSPIRNRGRRRFCPVCPVRTLNTEEHVLLECQSVAGMRRDLGILEFVKGCLITGDKALAFELYVNGKNCKGAMVSRQDHLMRGRDLGKMVEGWLDLWARD